MSSSIGVAVIGAGKISEQHLRFLSRCESTHVKAVCDLSCAMARFAAESYGIPRWYSQVARMLEVEEPQVVHVLTPPGTHVEIATACIESGAHVVIEKPMATSAADCRALIELAEENGRFIIEDHNYRFNWPVRELDRLLAEHAIGEMAELEIRLCLDLYSGRYGDPNLPHPSHDLPAGVLHEFVTHLAYLGLHFLGDYDGINASWRNLGGSSLFRYDDLDAMVDGEGRRCRIRFCSNTWPECFSLHLRGNRGEVRAELFHPIVEILRPRACGSRLSPVVNLLATGWARMIGGVANLRDMLLQRTAYEGLHAFLDRVYRSIEKGEDLPVTREEMLETSNLVDALLLEATS